MPVSLKNTLTVEAFLQAKILYREYELNQGEKTHKHRAISTWCISGDFLFSLENVLFSVAFHVFSNGHNSTLTIHYSYLTFNLKLFVVSIQFVVTFITAMKRKPRRVLFYCIQLPLGTMLIYIGLSKLLNTHEQICSRVKLLQCNTCEFSTVPFN